MLAAFSKSGYGSYPSQRHVIPMVDDFPHTRPFMLLLLGHGTRTQAGIARLG